MTAQSHTAHPLDGAFVTTESIGGADPATRSAVFKVAFTGEGCVERVHAAEDYIKALVAADRTAPPLLEALRGILNLCPATCETSDAQAMADIAREAIAKATGASNSPEAG